MTGQSTPDDPFRCHHVAEDGTRCKQPTDYTAGWCAPHGRERTTYTDTRSDSDVLRDTLAAVDQMRRELRWGLSELRKELKK